MMDKEYKPLPSLHIYAPAQEHDNSWIVGNIVALKALRDAFDATMKDPEFIKQAEQIKVEVDPVSGESIQKVVAQVLATPPHLIERAKPLVE